MRGKGETLLKKGFPPSPRTPIPFPKTFIFGVSVGGVLCRRAKLPLKNTAPNIHNEKGRCPALCFAQRKRPLVMLKRESGRGEYVLAGEGRNLLEKGFPPSSAPPSPFLKLLFLGYPGGVLCGREKLPLKNTAPKSSPQKRPPPDYGQRPFFMQCLKKRTGVTKIKIGKRK